MERPEMGIDVHIKTKYVCCRRGGIKKQCDDVCFVSIGKIRLHSNGFSVTISIETDRQIDASIVKPKI